MIAKWNGKIYTEKLRRKLESLLDKMTPLMARLIDKFNKDEVSCLSFDTT